MFRLSVNCPLHGLPYEYVDIGQQTKGFLRCKSCPFECTSLRISNEVEYMKARMGKEKTKQRERSRSKSKSKGKKPKPNNEIE